MSLPHQPDSRFSPTLSRIRKSIPQSWVHRDVTTPAFASLVSAQGATLTFEDHLYLGRFSWRMVHLATPRAEMLNILVFPESESAAPIFVCELMTFTHKPVVGVIDLAPFDQTSTQVSKTILESAHQQFARLVSSVDRPDWYEDCRSGHDFFVRPENFTQLTELQLAAEFVWDLLLKTQAKIDIPARGLETPAKIINYKSHHLTHNPGRPFLHRLFGPELSEEFLSRHLYR